jgi:hypothetical protein
MPRFTMDLDSEVRCTCIGHVHSNRTRYSSAPTLKMLHFSLNYTPIASVIVVRCRKVQMFRVRHFTGAVGGLQNVGSHFCSPNHDAERIRL